MKNDHIKSKMPKKLSKKQQKAADILALKASAHEAEMRVAAEIDGRLARLELRMSAGEQRLDVVERRPAQQGKQGDPGLRGKDFWGRT